jgi:integrase
LDPLKVSVANLADFLLHLHLKGLAVVTIEGYRTAISHTLKAVSNLDIGKDHHLSALIANFDRTISKQKDLLVPWDLSLVLRKLRKKPFEPLKEIDMKHLTFKTVFLLALATGKRRSEIHAWRKDVLYTEEWKSVTIVPDPSFIAKTQLVGRQPVLDSVEVKSLSNFLGDDMGGDLTLCPVRALKMYLVRTRDIRKERTKLFISFKQGYSAEIHANTISSWLKKVIIMTHEESTDKDHRILGIKAHQVRGVAASWANLNNISMDDIMTNCSWKNHNTFTSYYLKDLALIRDDMHHLGPVMVPGLGK